MLTCLQREQQEGEQSLEGGASVDLGHGLGLVEDQRIERGHYP